MLLNKENKKDFDNIISVLTILNRRTDGRYFNNIEKIKENLKVLNDLLNEEIEIVNKLKKFNNKGFKINKYLNASYSDFNTMMTKLKRLCTDLTEIEKIILKFNELPSDIKNSETAKRLESIIYNPENIMEIKSLYSKLRKRS